MGRHGWILIQSNYLIKGELDILVWQNDVRGLMWVDAREPGTGCSVIVPWHTCTGAACFLTWGSGPPGVCLTGSSLSFSFFKYHFNLCQLPEAQGVLLGSLTFWTFCYMYLTDFQPKCTSSALVPAVPSVWRARTPALRLLLPSHYLFPWLPLPLMPSQHPPWQEFSQNSVFFLFIYF